MPLHQQKVDFFIRSGVLDDLSTLCNLDEVAQENQLRVEFIKQSLTINRCFIIESGHKAIGYGVLEQSFFGNAFIAMLYIKADMRRQGAGYSLLNHIASICCGQKLFTSTNLSNLPMQTLLTKSGFSVSGIVQNLDEDDPEVIYFKPPRGDYSANQSSASAF